MRARYPRALAALTLFCAVAVLSAAAASGGAASSLMGASVAKDAVRQTLYALRRGAALVYSVERKA